jgi:hypothetical protein
MAEGDVNESARIRPVEKYDLQPPLPAPGLGGNEAAILLAALLLRERARAWLRQDRGRRLREPEAVERQP